MRGQRTSVLRSRLHSRMPLVQREGSSVSVSWGGRSLLVTGAGGFIGSHLAEELVRRGARVRAFVRYTSRFGAGFLDDLSADVTNGVEVIRGDLRDADAVDAAVAGTDTVFHLGALIGIPYSYVHPRETIDTNVSGTLNVATAALRHEVRRLVHTSSSEVYGTAQVVPIDESHPLQGQSPYSASKIGADKIVESYWQSFGLPAATVRPFNTYGPRQSARAVIPTIIAQALKGDTVKLGNLTPRRDFTYVSDTVAGVIRAAEVDDVVGQVVNLGTGSEISIGELITLVGDLLGKHLEPVDDEIRVRPAGSEVERLCSDNSLARRVLRWSPEIGLTAGLERTIEWIGRNLDRFEVGKYAV